MGYYINQNSKGAVLDADFKTKVNELLADGAEVVHQHELHFQPNLVCVVNHGEYGAAGFAYSEEEFKRFMIHDGRPKVWLLYPPAATVSGYNNDHPGQKL